MSSLYCLNRIIDCEGDKAPTRDVDDITQVVVHRASFADPKRNEHPVQDSLLDSPGVAVRDRAVPGIGRMAYHFVVRGDDTGTVEQALPLSRRGAHCIGANRNGIGVAVVGDTTRLPAGVRQWRKLVLLCSRLVLINKGLRIVGHDQVPGGSSDPSKSCPGEYLPIKALVDNVVAQLPVGWRAYGPGQVAEILGRAGVVV